MFEFNNSIITIKLLWFKRQFLAFYGLRDNFAIKCINGLGEFGILPNVLKN